MLAMCAELGFHIADDPDDPGVKDGATATAYPTRRPMTLSILPDKVAKFSSTCNR